MKHTKIFLIAALLGTVLASCQKEVDVKPEEKPVDTKSWTLTVKATMDQGTKAMSLEGTTLKSYWSAGETVGVYLGDKKVGILTASNVTNEGANADLSGTLTDIEGLTTSNVFTLIFPDKDVLTYLGQDGSSPAASQTMADNFDYATATVTISEIDPSTMVITAGSNADFTSLQSIYRLRFKEDGGSYFNVNSISITSSLNRLVRTMGPVNDLMDSDCGTLTMVPTVTPQDYYYYMAIRNENTVDDQTYSFSVVRNDDNALLEGVKSIPATALKDPAYIPVTVKMSQKVKMSSETVDTAL